MNSPTRSPHPLSLKAVKKYRFLLVLSASTRETKLLICTLTFASEACMAETWSHHQINPGHISPHLEDSQLGPGPTDSLPNTNNLERDSTIRHGSLPARRSPTSRDEANPTRPPHALSTPSNHSFLAASSDIHASCNDVQCCPQRQQSKVETGLPVISCEKSLQHGGKRLHAATNNKQEKGTKARNKVTKPQGLRKTKSTQRPGRQFEMAWRIGQAPAPAVRLSQSDRCFQQAFTITSQYYRGNADTRWRSMLSQHASRFNHDQSPLSFFCSLVVVAGLLAGGLTPQAHQTWETIRPLATSVLLAQHPMIYAFIADMAMETSTDPMPQLRASLGKRLSIFASQTLGLKHPISLIFKLPLTNNQKNILRGQLQATIQQEMTQVFEAHSYQPTIHYGFWCRVLAKSGKAEEAALKLNRLIPSLEQSWGMNTSLPILGILELARTELVMGVSSVKLECMLADCLRRLDVLSQNTQNADPNVTDPQIPLDSLLFIRISALRMLGRVWVMRGNFSAALACFEHSVAIAAPVLRPGGVTMRICRADVAMTKTMQMELERDGAASGDPMSRLPDLQTITHFILFDF